jgi:protein tyrosine/serine phosphatase
VYVIEFGSTRYMFKNLDDSKRKKFQLKNLILKKKLVARIENKNVFWDISTKPKIRIL